MVKENKTQVIKAECEIFVNDDGVQVNLPKSIKRIGFYAGQLKEHKLCLGKVIGKSTSLEDWAFYRVQPIDTPLLKTEVCTSPSQEIHGRGSISNNKKVVR